MQLGVSEATVTRWRGRFAAARLEGLADRPRPGRPPSVPAEKQASIVTATLGRPPGQAARWSRALMARQTGLSAATIGRVWSRSGLAPHVADDPGRGHAPARPAVPARRPGSEITFPTIILVPGRRGGAASRSRTGDRAAERETGLLAAERRNLLLARLGRDGRLVARDLAAELGLSDDTVRRDLRDLAAAGLCQRVYGGALPISPILNTTHDQRSRIALDSKRRVAAAAARLITPGSTVILDGGSTALEVVMALPPDLEATIITPSLMNAIALASHPKVTVHTLSGQLHKGNMSSMRRGHGRGGLGGHCRPRPGHRRRHPPAARSYHRRPRRRGDEADTHRPGAATYVMASIEKLGTVSTCKVAGLREGPGSLPTPQATPPSANSTPRERPSSPPPLSPLKMDVFRCSTPGGRKGGIGRQTPPATRLEAS